MTSSSDGYSSVFGDLADLLSRTDPARLLPEGRVGSVRITGPTLLRCATPLGPGHLTVVEDAMGATFVVPMVVAADGCRRARAGDGLAQALVARLPDASLDSPDIGVELLHAHPAGGERSVGVDQTHESLIVGDRCVVKWTVAAAPGAQPAPQRLRALDSAGFAAIPQPWAFVTWAPTDRPPVLLASVAAYLPGAEDGWTWFVDVVGAAARGMSALDDAVTPARRIGELTAQMHLALAGKQPESQAGRLQMQVWAERAGRALDDAIEEVGGDEGLRLRRRASAIRADFSRVPDAAPTPVIDVHGDFHVGQVLRYPDPTGWRYAFTDFDGNPVLTPEQRLEQQPAARDVAGMLASLDHVGRVVLRRIEGVDADVVARWIDAAESAFLTSYRDTLRAAGRSSLLDERLLRAFRAEQECREYLYAVRHLPHWRYVPDAACAALYPDDEE